MGYVTAASLRMAPGHSCVRGKELVAKVVAMPFTPHRYFRG